MPTIDKLNDKENNRQIMKPASAFRWLFGTFLPANKPHTKNLLMYRSSSLFLSLASLCEVLCQNDGHVARYNLEKTATNDLQV